MPPSQYDTVELICDVESGGVTIPAGTQGTIVELQGNPTEAFMVEFDCSKFGDAFLPDLSASQFRVIKRSSEECPL